MILPVIFILLIVFGIGLPITLLIVPKMNSTGRLGISFPIGLGIFTLLMFISNLLGLKIGSINTSAQLLVLGGTLILIKRKDMKKYLTNLSSVISAQPDLYEKAFIAAIFILIISSFISTLYWPVYTWDALTLYDLRAKVLVQFGFMRGMLLTDYFIGYPPLTSLAHTIVYLAGGKNPQFIYSTFYLSIALAFYGLLREVVSRKLSLLFTLILVAVPQFFNQSIISYTNLPYTVFFSTGAIFYYVWDKARKPGFLIMSAILVGFSAWTRSAEPLWIAVFLTVILASILRRKFLNIIIFSGFFFPIQQAWTLYQTNWAGTENLTTSQVGRSVSFLSRIIDVNRWFQVLTYLYKYVVAPWGASIYIFVFSMILAVLTKKLRSALSIFIVIFLLISMVLYGTYITSIAMAGWLGIGDSVTRMTMIFYPLFIYASALLFGKSFD